MIKIGGINIDVSHPKSFSEYLKKGSRARYAAVYNDGFRGDDEVSAFINNYEIDKRCETVDELADYVDIGFIQGCNWDRHIKYVQPFIDRKKPVFIDKPIVGNIRDCDLLEKAVKEGAVILGSSSVRYAKEINEFNEMPCEQKGETVNVFGTAGVDEYNYGIHIVEGIGGIMGTGAVSCRFVGRNAIQDKVGETYYIRYENGTSAVYNTFQGIWQPFEMVIMTTKSTYRFRIDTTKIYGELLDRICDYIETGENRLASIETLTESVKIMLAGRLSRQSGGAEIKLRDIPKDDPGYNGYEFEKGYAANAKKIYL